MLVSLNLSNYLFRGHLNVQRIFEKNNPNPFDNFLGKQFCTNIYTEGLMHLLGESRELLCNKISAENMPDNDK